jgi:hypothetical protein
MMPRNQKSGRVCSFHRKRSEFKRSKGHIAETKAACLIGNDQKRDFRVGMRSSLTSTSSTLAVLTSTATLG